MLKVLMVSSEVAPFAKTGGLGDVLGALPKALAKKDVDIRVVMPKYKCIPEKFTGKMRFNQYLYVNLGWRNQYCGVFELVEDGVTYYFIDNEYYFGGSSLYGGYNEIERFSFFSKAAIEILQFVDFKPDVVHCHDWQAGIIPVLLDAFYRRSEFYRDIRTVFSIHNLQYQGIHSRDYIRDLLHLPAYYFTSDKMEFYGDANYLKSGVVYADYVTTVSPTYAEEIKQPFFGERLDGLLRAKSNRLTGILNGIDYDVYSPNNDEKIYKSYNARNWRAGKKANKLALQEELGLEQNENIPMIGLISRLVGQKGLDLVAAVMGEIVENELQLVILGTGDPKYENLFRQYEWNHQRKVSASIMFDDTRAHRIYAASDMFLMPSLFEPCGLGQLISLSYGTLPIVREVGGLRDTIRPYNEYTGEGNGFSFWAYNAHDMYYTIRRALELYKDKETWGRIVRNAMKCDYSWEVSADKYIEVYEKITAKP